MKRALLLLALVGCKSRGTIELTTVDGGVAGEATQVHVYAIEDLGCPCACGACAEQCTDDTTCVRADDGALIPRGDPIALDLHAGAWAVIVEYLLDDGTMLASACETFEVDADGTADKPIALEPEACTP